MSRYRIEASAVIDAKPAVIYAVLADYRVGHPAILPKPYFTGLSVEVGGYGAGTRIEVQMNVLGARRVFHQVVDEPEPGRMLRESDGVTTTTFTVDPRGAGCQSRVTLATVSRAAPGLTGWVERALNPFIIRHIFRRQLGQLADYVRSGPQIDPAGFQNEPESL